MIRWEKGKVLGHGGSSTVYECKIFPSGELAAVKEVNKNGLSSQQIQVIEAEIDLLKTLAHPNIIQYIGTEITNTHFYIFLEYAEGGSLRQLYLKHGKLSDQVIIYFLRQVLSGLLYLQLKGIAHRDIKGANILITYDGIAKLADFGSSKKLIMESLVSGIKGTPHFMSPEVIKGTQQSWFKADIWAIGCLAVELSSGKLPYSAKYENSMTVMFKIANGEKPPINRENTSIELVSFIDKCCAIDPSVRPPVEDLLQDSFLHDHSNLTQVLSTILQMISDDNEDTSNDNSDEQSTLTPNNASENVKDDAIPMSSTIVPSFGKSPPEKVPLNGESSVPYTAASDNSDLNSDSILSEISGEISDQSIAKKSDSTGTQYDKNTSKVVNIKEALPDKQKIKKRQSKDSSPSLLQVQLPRKQSLPQQTAPMLTSSGNLMGSFAMRKAGVAENSEQKEGYLRKSGGDTFNDNCLSYSSSKHANAQMDRQRAPISSDALRIGNSASSDTLFKISSTGSAAIRRNAKEEMEASNRSNRSNRSNGNEGNNVIKFQKSKSRSTAATNSNTSVSGSNGRSHSADIINHKARQLPPIQVDSSVSMSLNSSLPRIVQSAPTISTYILSPLPDSHQVSLTPKITSKYKKSSLHSQSTPYIAFIQEEDDGYNNNTDSY